jgi:hypothetical protein
MAAINISIFWELGRVVQEKTAASVFYPEDGGRSFLRKVNYHAKLCQISKASNLHILVQGHLNHFTMTPGKLDATWTTE